MNADQATPPARNPAARIAVVVVILLLAMVVVYALMDRMAPSSSRGIVSAAVVQIAPRVSGEVIEVMVEDDAVVQAGDPLFRLDTRPFDLALAQAEANLTSTAQEIDASSASLVAAQAAVTQARTALETTRAEAERTFRLEERGIAAAARGDTARGQVADAEARRFVAGEDQHVDWDGDWGYLIAAHDLAGDVEPLGVGLFIDGELRSQVPKGRRRKLIDGE